MINTTQEPAAGRDRVLLEDGSSDRDEEGGRAGRRPNQATAQLGSRTGARDSDARRRAWT